MYYVTIIGPDSEEVLREIIVKSTDDKKEAAHMAHSISETLPILPYSLRTVCFVMDEAGSIVDLG